MARLIIADTFEDGAIGAPYVSGNISAPGGVYSSEAAFGSRGLYLASGLVAGLFLEPDGDRPASGVGGYHKAIDEDLGTIQFGSVGWTSREPGSYASGVVIASSDQEEIRVIETDAIGDFTREETVAAFPREVGWVHMRARGSSWLVETLGGTTLASGTFLSTPDAYSEWHWEAGTTLGEAGEPPYGSIYIDNPYYWGDLFQVVRQYPRDDEYGYSGGRRKYPPPRLGRIIGSQS